MKINSVKFIKSIEKGSGIYKIYAILCLNTKDVIYVGQTKGTLGSRLSDHKFYLGIKDIGIMLITNTDNQSDESKYIKLFKDLGFNLLNKNNGISEKILKEKLSDEEKENNRKEWYNNYYNNNKKVLIENMKKYQEENKEKLKEYRREYYKQYYLKNKLK